LSNYHDSTASENGSSLVQGVFVTNISYKSHWYSYIFHSPG